MIKFSTTRNIILQILNGGEWVVRGGGVDKLISMLPTSKSNKMALNIYVNHLQSQSTNCRELDNIEMVTISKGPALSNER